MNGLETAGGEQEKPGYGLRSRTRIREEKEELVRRAKSTISAGKRE